MNNLRRIKMTTWATTTCQLPVSYFLGNNVKTLTGHGLFTDSYQKDILLINLIIQCFIIFLFFLNRTCLKTNTWVTNTVFPCPFLAKPHPGLFIPNLCPSLDVIYTKITCYYLASWFLFHFPPPLQHH